jgi:hypothetical protein
VQFALRCADPALGFCFALFRTRWARIFSSKDRHALFDERLHASSAIGRRMHLASAIHLKRQSLLEWQLLRRKNRGFGLGDRDRRATQCALPTDAQSPSASRRYDAIHQPYTRGLLCADPIVGEDKFRCGGASYWFLTASGR